MIMELAAIGFGGAAAAIGMQVYRAHRAAETVAAWILVANVNTLLRLDLDHITGDDDNHGLRELRVALKEIAAKRSDTERKLLEHFNALVGVAIAFGERVHDAAGNVDMRAVANRRAHVQNALALGDRIEAAFGGINQLASDAQTAAANGETVRSARASAAPVATIAFGHRGRTTAPEPVPVALVALAAPAAGART